MKKLKAKLDKVFSWYIRTRDLDEFGLATCFTCQVKKSPKQQHAGHFMTRVKLATRFDPINVQCQCPKCNLFSQGEQYLFGINLDKKYGEGTAERLRRASQETRRFSQSEYEELIEYYQTKTKENLEESGWSG